MTILLSFWPFRRALIGGSVDSRTSSPPDEDQDPPATSLRHYATPGVSPPSARVDPKLKLQPRRPVRLWDAWKYAVVVASKATEVSADIISHHIWGPRKGSWGIEMTIVSSLMRGAGRHSSLVDIGAIRMLMSIGGLVPLPSDALVTPVTFRVRQRNLRGILATHDAAETGSRELSGEWVVGKKTWQRLQAEWKASHLQNDSNMGNSVEQPFRISKKKERVILYIHGGAYYLSSAAAQRLISIPLSKHTDARVFALDYRLAPETQFPGPLHDAVSAYLRLTEDLHIPPENIIISGDSAGGGLSLSLLMYLRDNNYPLPSGAILMSPWVDLTMSCESWDSNAMYDVVPFPTADSHMNPIALYLGEQTEKYLTHPYASPLFGDYKGLPPLLIQAGDAEVLRDEITLLAHKATLAGVQVRHELYEDAIHVFQAYPFLSSSRRSFMSMGDFVRNILPQCQTRSPQLLDYDAEQEMEHEIDNENAIVVRGDGTEVTTGMEAVEESFGSTPFAESEGEDDNARVPNDYSSWGHSRNWSLSTTAPDNADTSDSDGSSDEALVPKSITTRHRSETLRSMPSLRRMRSAISLITSNTRSQNSQSRLSMHSPPLGCSPRRAIEKISVPAYTFAGANSPPPSPSIRRSSHASHSDISSLVDDWTHAGPANQTHLYSADEYI